MKPANTDIAGSVPLLASALDPRHKHLGFLSPEMARAVKDKLRAEYQRLPAPGDNEDGAVASTSTTTDGPSQPKKDRSCLTSLFRENYGQREDQDELESYWQQSCIASNEDLVAWWIDKSPQYPRLSLLAGKYLCVPATSVPAERVFSVAGLIVNKLRSRLSPEHVDMLISLNKNKFHHASE